MNENPMVSVIIPIYKVEGCLCRAVDSVLSQTFSDFELFLVDDGSPDKSGELCDAYAQKDARVRVLHKQNGGAASARNAAMDVAAGKYFYFMDGDDWAEPNMLKHMVSLAENARVELLIAGYYIDTYVSDTEFLSQAVYLPDALYDSRESFRKNAYLLFDRNLLYTPWNKLYLASVIREKGLRFPNTLWDDLPFNLAFIRDVERVAVTSERFYHFLRARAESETAKYVETLYEKREEEHGWLLELYRYWGQRDENSREFLARRYVERLIGCVENLTDPACALTEGEKHARVQKMLRSPRLQSSLKYARPNSCMMRAMLMPYRLKNARFALAQSRVISRVKTGDTRLFATLKAKR